MRIESGVPPITVSGQKISYADWVISVGDGKVHTVSSVDEGESCWTEIPSELFLDPKDDGKRVINETIYFDLCKKGKEPSYFRDRAILTPLNEDVDAINKDVLNQWPGESKVYLSSDSICKGSVNYESQESMYPLELLNSMRFAGIPNHELELKIGAPIVLLRNIAPAKGLCNGTRLIITQLCARVTEGIIITGNHIITMERTYRYLNELTCNKEDITVKVRITREWEARSPTNHLLNKNYILMDEQGMLLHVQLATTQIDEYKRKIKVGKVYLISGFATVPANDTYRPVTGDNKIIFTGKTIIKKIDNELAIPRHGFELRTFNEEKSRVGGIKTLIDVIGKLKFFTPIQSLSGGKEKLEITLQDNTGDEMTITLWGLQAHQFEDLKSEYQRPNVVLIVTGTKAVLFNGNPILSATSATQYFINLDYPAANILRNKGEDKMIPVIVQPMRNPAQLMLDNIDNLSIQTLFNVIQPDGKEEFFCSIEATVVGIVPNYGWFYTACNKCNTKMTNPPQCSNCTNIETGPAKKYSVTLKVEDQTSVTTVLLFDKFVLDLIKVPVQHVLDNDEIVTPTNIPSILKNIVGGKFKFYLKITKHNTTGGKKEGFKVNAYAPGKAVNKEKRSKESNVFNHRKGSKTRRNSCIDYQEISDDDKMIPQDEELFEENSQPINRISDGSDTDSEVALLKRKNAYTPGKEVNKEKRRKESNVFNQRKGSKTKRSPCMDYQEISDDDEMIPKSVDTELEKTENTAHKEKNLQTSTVRQHNNGPKMLRNVSKIQAQAQTQVFLKLKNVEKKTRNIFKNPWKITRNIRKKVVRKKSHLDTTDEAIPKSVKLNEVQNTVNTTCKIKKLQTATTKLSDNKPKIQGKATKIQPQAQIDKNYINSAEGDDAIKRRKRTYNKKRPLESSDDSSGEEEKKNNPNVPLLLSQETDSGVGRNQNCKKKYLEDEMTKKDTRTNKRKQIDRKEKMAKVFKKNSKLPTDNKTKNADTLDEDQNMENSASNNKMIQTATAVKNVKKPNPAKKSTGQQNCKEPHSLSASKGTVKTVKKIYNKEGPTKIFWLESRIQM
ncbi:hypothetical protein POM88_052221 [Heracleum sosnowskyi]|uniref:ATP-dependent DNA helicase n=1 Tax=Heracleum sosnowskyi TaxID=360622 RepID=A0AAD8GSM3_9APIA|nr:hypothetical protein POM88_052221 [Heracleum sosnowskyi]